VIGGGVATAIILSRLKPQPALEKSYDISESTILNYKVSAGTDIYYCNDFSRGETNNITLDHDLLDLKALSDDNECVTKFVITQDIDFGFLVNPNMDCKLSAINNAIVNCVSNSSSAYGIIVGRVELNDGIFKGKMEIDSSMTFNIIKTSVDYLGYGALGGVMFYSNSSESNIEINGTFKITGGNYGYGVQFRSNISGILTISGIFYVSATARACGFYCNGDAQKDSVQTINGVFTISSANEDASGAYYKSARSFSTQTINGVFTICGYALTILLRFEQSYVNSHQNITGVFTIYSPSSAACLLYCDEDSFHGLVNFNSVIVNFCESEKPIIGHLSCGNLNNWQVMMSAVKCFSQFIENYNI
jgi:hypothetical protein